MLLSVTLVLIVLKVPASILTFAMTVMLWPLVLKGLDPNNFSLNGADFTALAGGWLAAISLMSVLLQPLKIHVRFRSIALVHTIVAVALFIAILLAPTADKHISFIILGSGVIGLVTLALVYVTRTIFNLIDAAFSTQAQGGNSSQRPNKTLK